MKQILQLFCIGIYTFSLTGCGAQPEMSLASDVPSSDASSSETETISGQGTYEAQSTTVTLYIGSDGQFEEYQVKYTGERTETGLVPASQVLSAMADLTGWNLDLADQIYSGRGGITVTFADTCTLLSGSSEEETPADITQKDKMLLDSVKRTLQCWAVDPELGDPDSVDIWFCGPDGGDLVLTGTDIILSSTEPYQGLPNT